MLTIRVNHDAENQSITWKLEEGEPDAEYEGKPCYTVSNGVSSDRLRDLLRLSNFEMIGVRAVDQSGFTEPYIVEYWARREKPDG